MLEENIPALVVLMGKVTKYYHIRFLICGYLTVLIIFFLLTNPTLVEAKVFYGKVVGTEFSVIQVRGYEMLKKARNWDDETLCKELKISEKAIEEIKNRHKPKSKGVGLKMLYELFPQMAV